MSHTTNTTPGRRQPKSSRALSHSQSQSQSQSNTSSPGTAAMTPSQRHEQDKEITDAEAKRRKIQRACDACRRKKIKCDGPMNSLSTSKCAHCQEYAIECTYVEAAKRRGPPKGYVETLEQRCSRLEKLILQLQPSLNIQTYAGPLIDRDDFDLSAYQESLRSLNIPPFPEIKPLAANHSSSSPAGAAPSPLSNVLGQSPWRTYERDPSRPNDNDEDDDDDARMQEHVANSMNKLRMRDSNWRYHGKSSGAYLMRTFNDLKYRDNKNRDFITDVNKKRREQFWHLPEWEAVVSGENVHPLDYSVWPDDKLAVELIDAYFDHVNLYLPLLNRPLFLSQYHSGSWRSDEGFARLCLMVFANGARFVDDPRVYWPVYVATSQEGKERMQTDRDGTLKYSAGWKYLQVLCQVLVCTFLHGSAVPHLEWIVSGIGLRGAQEIGIHVRSTMLNADPVERAMYNRAFWCLYHIDREHCAWIGRSVALQDTDFDIDYPIAVDDEYWQTGHVKTDFKQPPTKGTASVAAFVQTLKLDHIMGAALRTIYAINKLPEHRADPQQHRAVVLELDNALNAWADGVPDDLRWDPTRADYRYFKQSAALYTYYYYCQIMIHRPFISTNNNSHVTCANAARSICNIIDAALRRGRQAGCLPGRALHASFMLPSWIASIITLINIYMGKQTPAERERAVMDIKRCLAASRELELTWRHAGKMTDMILVLGAEEDMPPIGVNARGEKRSADASSIVEQPTSHERVVTPPAVFGLGPFRNCNPVDGDYNSAASTSQNTARFENQSIDPNRQYYSVPTNTTGVPQTAYSQEPQLSGFFDPNSFENQLFDLGTTMLSGQDGATANSWASLLSDFAAPGTNGNNPTALDWGVNFWNGENPDPRFQTQTQTQTQTQPQPSQLSQAQTQTQSQFRLPQDQPFVYEPYSGKMW